ncbi:MAG: hypothetical protein ABIC40_05865 [bacterium]
MVCSSVIPKVVKNPGLVSSGHAITVNLLIIPDGNSSDGTVEILFTS